MSIDVSSLRRFQELWEPVIQSIPAVLNMVEMEADMDRALAAKKAELDKVQKAIDAAQEQAQIKLNDANSELAAVASKKEALQQEVTELSIKAKDISDNVDKQRQEAVGLVNAAVAEVKAKLNEIQGEYSAKRAKAEAEHSKMITQMVAEIDALNERKEAAQAALDEIKAKLG